MRSVGFAEGYSPGEASTVNPNHSVTLVHAKDHPVLIAQHSWHVVEVRLHCPRDTAETIRVELVLAGEGKRRQLRFDGVTDFSLTQAMIGTSVRVLDVTHLQWRGIDVRVESICGSLGFWARSVTEEQVAAKQSPIPPGRRGAKGRGRSPS